MKVTRLDCKSTMLLGASSLAVASAALLPSTAALAQSCPGIDGDVCEFTVTQDDTLVSTQGDTLVTNQANGTSITQSAFGYLLIDNQAGASIAALSFAPLVSVQPPLYYQPVINPHPGLFVVNSGTIEGDVLFQAGGVYVDNGGTVTGNWGAANPSGFNVDVFIDRAGPGTGIAGTMNAGLGFDTYVTSFAADGTYDVTAALPATFEGWGIEALGTGTTVTLTSPQGQAGNGLVIWGNGSVVNRATIGLPEFSATGIPQQFVDNLLLRAVIYRGEVGKGGSISFSVPGPVGPVTDTFHYGGALQSFINEGVINGDLLLATASFENSGTVNLRSNEAGTLIVSAADTDFSFINSGTMAMTDSGARPNPLLQTGVTIATAPDSTVPAAMTITNTASGTISGGLAVNGFASNFAFVNDGLIEIGANPNNPYYAVDIEVGNYDLALGDELSEDVLAAFASVENNGTILGGIGANFTADVLSFTNTGLIRSNPADVYSAAVEVSTDDYALVFGEDDVYDSASFTFDNSGTIEGAALLELESSQVTVINSGDITQSELGAIEGFGFLPYARQTLEVSSETSLDGQIAITNSGLIANADFAGSALSVEAEAGDLDSELPGAAQATAVAEITNSGTIAASGGVFVTPGPQIGLPEGINAVHFSTAIAASLDGEGGSALVINNLAGGVIVNQQSQVRFGTFGDPVIVGQGRGTAIAARADTITITNNGLIEGGPGAGLGGPANEFVFDGQFVANADMEGVIGSAIDTFFSQDTITNGAGGTITGGIALRQGDDYLYNQGTISGNIWAGSGADLVVNDGLITGIVNLGDGDDRFATLLSRLPENAAGLTIVGGAGNDGIVFLAQNGGSLQSMALLGHSGIEYLGLGADGAGTVTSDGAVAMAPIQLFLGDITLAQGSTLLAAGEFALLGDAPLAQSFTNRGTIIGSVQLGAEGDFFANYGTLTGNLDLGSGDDIFVQGINASFTGIADGGTGYDSFQLDITGGGTINQAIYSQLINFEVLGLTGSGTIITDGTDPLPVQTVEISGGETVEIGPDSVIQTLGPVAITGTDEANSLNIQGTVNGGIDLAGGDNQFTNSGTVNGDVSTGDGDNSLANDGTLNGSVSTGSGSDQLANTGTITGNVNTGGGDDQFTNDGTVEGDVNLDGQGGIIVPAAFAGFLGTSGPIMAAPAALTGGDDVFTNTGEIEGNVDAGAGNDVITNSGSIGGNVLLGEGNDELLLTGAWEIGGTASGGGGTDRLSIASNGTMQTPREFSASAFTGFEAMRLAGGTLAVSGAMAFDTIEVNSGYLFGRAGSAISGDVTVASGAVFGSAGTVNGNVAVNGTLSPGASPGTMTINGDVSLNAGSTTVFEMTPTVSDAIVINGSLDIASGTTLTITGSRPLTPGVAYNLITASGGIDGSFGTISQASTVLGFLSQTDTALQLLGTFQLGSGASVQSALAADYLNTLLVAGTAPAGVLAAIPQLLGEDGFVNEAAILSTTPEAYASGVQMGIENGLAISAAVRSAAFAAASGEGGVFVFGEGFGQWRGMSRDFASGISGTDLESYGALGGIGFGNGQFSVTGFAGHVEARQDFTGIAASGQSDGMFAGASVEAAISGVTAGVTAIYDWSEASTSRAVLSGPAASAAYDLNTLTVDGHLGFAFPVGGGWQVGPEAGLTYIEVERKGLTETGGGAFGLTVAGQSYDALFLGGDVVFSRSEGTWRPYLAVGIRHQLDGDPIAASASLTGVAASYGIPGAERQRDYAHVGAGFAVQVAPSFDLFGRWNSEFANGQDAHGLSGGVRLSF